MDGIATVRFLLLIPSISLLSAEIRPDVVLPEQNPSWFTRTMWSVWSV